MADEFLILLLNKLGDTIVLPVKLCESFQDVLLKVCGRLSIHDPCSIKMFYNIPDYPNCILESDGDFKAMFQLCKSFSTTRVHVEIKKLDLMGFDDVEVDHEDEIDLSRGSSRLEPLVRSTDMVPVQNVGEKLGWEKLSLFHGLAVKGGAVEFRLILQKISLFSGYQYSYTKNNANRVFAICSFKEKSNCTWFVHGHRDTVNDYMYVTKVCNIHTCGTVGRSFNGTRMSSNLASTVVQTLVKDDPNLSPTFAKRFMFHHHGLRSSYDIARGGVEKAKCSIFGDTKQSFNSLPAYVQAIRDSNPGSKVVLDVLPETYRFQRIFLALDACIRGFMHCRPLLYLDAAHLRGEYTGALLVATARDGNEGMYPVCFAVVDSESKPNWIWFLNELKSLTGLRPISFLSDRNAGLIAAISINFPNSYHGFCLFHLKQNFREKFPKGNHHKTHKERMVDQLVSCAYATTKDEYNEKMEQLKFEGGTVVTNFFMGIDPSTWARSHFPNDRYGYMSSSVAESFNSWVLKERLLPVVHMVDAIRIKIMEIISDRRTQASLWNKYISPVIDGKLSVKMDECRNWRVISSTLYNYEVHSSPTAAVNLRNLECSCNEWQIFGYPCVHAVAAIQSINGSFHQFIDVCFLAKSFSNTYQYPVYPIPSSVYTTNCLSTDIILPPPARRLSGRPRTRRFKSRGEVSKQIRCSRCGKVDNHNRRTCDGPIQ